ncbi:MAG: hypothetical protein HQ509_05910 [Candidatus Marinimicrobia bacterium]|nr:hypothetical protein [Candidatus Neomarinimicrobiota bacterium]
MDYKSNGDGNILIRTFKGTVTVDVILSSWEYVISNNLITQNHIGVISDFRETNLLVRRESVKIFENFYDENIQLFKELKLAQIIDSPKIIFPLVLENSYFKI